ncbi:MAG: hypothetical protein ONB06_07865 [candidate division KSB1 bacterium]|nr:hypothetical protein [candidate division KSB1 bacterium]
MLRIIWIALFIGLALFLPGKSLNAEPVRVIENLRMEEVFLLSVVGRLP